MQISEYLIKQKKIIENHLQTFFPSKNCPQKKIFNAAKYSLFAKSKRIRPILTLACSELFDKSIIKKALSPACAIEILHTYSLIHDDLPCMDDDDIRRGQPSLHKKYDETTAVLTGDYLLTLSFEIISNAPDLNDKQKIELIKRLSQSAGGNGMVGGQIVDVENNHDIDVEWMHKHKTGALIAASTEFAGIIASASKQQIQILKTFGEDIGLLFQIVDDILDVTSNEETLGKPVLSDEQNERKTFVSLFGLNGAKKMAQDHLQKTIQSLEQLPGDKSTLIEIANFITNRHS